LRDFCGLELAITGSPIEMADLKPGSSLNRRIITWIETITPSCKDMTHLLSQSMDRRLLLHTRLAPTDTLDLKRAEKRLDLGIVVTTGFATHAGNDALGLSVLR
jgi:hypothetical protein